VALPVFPDNLATILAEFDNRLKVLENTPRVGLNRVRHARLTAGALATTFNTYEFGPVGTTWADDQSNTGTGYPQLTLTTGQRALFMLTATPWNIGNDAGTTWKAQQAYVGVADTTGDPGSWTNPRMYAFHEQDNAKIAPTTICLAVVRTDLTPGPHTFRVGAFWTVTAPSAPTSPQLLDISLIVLPLDLP
jgi:hypothetical protein